MYCDKLFTNKLNLKKHLNECNNLEKIENILTNDKDVIKANDDLIKENEELKKTISVLLNINRQINDVIREIDMNNKKEYLHITDINFDKLTIEMIKEKEKGISLFLYLSILDSNDLPKVYLLDYKKNILRIKLENDNISYDKNGFYFQKFWYGLLQEQIIIRIFKEIHDEKERNELNEFYNRLFQKKDKSIHNNIMEEFKKRLIYCDKILKN
jgi:hypothetical protein